MTNYNLFLQRGDPLAQKIYPVTNELTRKLAMRFMLPKCYQGQRQVAIDMLEYENNYLPLNKVFVGFNNKQMLKKLFNDGSIDQNEYGKVLNAAVAFYKESLRCLLQKWICLAHFGNMSLGLTSFVETKLTGMT